jgi:hypothetical protein
VYAELDRRYPDRARMRPTDPAGFRTAWDILERLWAGTIARARELPPELLHESVDGEWSFIQTLRHLAFLPSLDEVLPCATIGPRPYDDMSTTSPRRHRTPTPPRSPNPARQHRFRRNDRPPCPFDSPAVR